MPTAPDIIVADTITKRFAGREVVKGLSFRVRRGEIFALLGPNGAGKTTCVRMLTGIIRPDAGRISIALDGRAGTSFPPVRSAYLPEERGLYREISVLRTLVYFGRLRGLERHDAERRARHWLERMGLADRGAERVDALSKGNQQRVQFIASVVHGPALAVLDEPFTGLDPISQEFFLDLVHDLRDGGTTVVLSAHQMDLVERIADRVLLMNDGREILSGAIADLHAHLDARPRIRLTLRPGGEPDRLRDDPDVDDVSVQDEGIEVTLRPSSDVSQFFARTLAALPVQGISSEPARLHDVFVRAVREDDARAAPAAAVDSGRRAIAARPGDGPEDRTPASERFLQALLVGGWEFQRYFKWRDQILGLLVFLVLSGLGYLGGRLANAGESRTTVAVAGVDLPALRGLDPGLDFEFVPLAERPQAEADLRAGSLDGILTRDADGAFSLRVHREPGYRGRLSAVLDGLMQRERLASRGLTPADLQQIVEPAPLAIHFTEPDRARAGRGEMVLAAVAGALVILAVFTSMAYLLTGITGEKQLRVTESLMSFVHPQAWIDGKILGIGAYALVNILNMAVGGLILALVAGLSWGFGLPDVAARPGVLLLLLVCSTLALLLWNAFFAAFAATIDDPNTSARTSVMFVPMLFVGLALWVVLRDPESTVARVLAIFPLTSSVALPARTILSESAAPEVLASLFLLAAAIWLVRRAAGRIFRVGMLLYGKEPGIKEMLGWIWRA